MNLGDVFVNSIVREIGRNYGKSLSNSLMGNSHSTPVRVLGHLGSDTGGRNYKNQLEKLCKTWQIKGPTATFNVAQNMYKSFFDLVEEAQKDSVVDINEMIDLIKNFTLMLPQMKKVKEALLQLGKPDLAEKVGEMQRGLLDFFEEMSNEFVLPDKPRGIFNSKKKKRWEVYKSVKEKLDELTALHSIQKKLTGSLKGLVEN